MLSVALSVLHASAEASRDTSRVDQAARAEEEAEAGMMSGDTSVDIVWEPPTQLSSLDCWDYSIELDCLRGPEGIFSLFVVLY